MEGIGYFVTLTLVVGLALVAFGIFSWLYEIMLRLNLPNYAMIAFIGLMLLFFGAMFGKIFSKVRW